MENKDNVTVSGNMQLQEGTNTFEIETDEVDGKLLEGLVAVDGAETAENGKLPRSTLILGVAIAAGVLAAGVLAVIGLNRKHRKQMQKERQRTLEGRKGQGGRSRQEEGDRQTTAVSHGRVSDLPAGEPERTVVSSVGEIQVGKVHNMGRRSAQQDSLGVTDVPEGVFAVVADGMGGLSDGDKVSQTIVMTMLQEISGRRGRGQGARLFETVSLANDAINRMLGMQSQYVSGSTVVAVLAGRDCFEWVSVGDSRVCLYRNGRLIQLNREHNYESELLWQAVNGEISFAEALENPKGRSLTSFIGMGRLKYIDGSLRHVETAPGDCLLLMSDGVFNTLPDEEICAILQDHPDPQRAALAMEERVLAYNNPKQDNFTAVILKFRS